MSRNFIILSVEGVIASGKSTLIDILKSEFDKMLLRTTIIPEPVELWRKKKRLQMFYNDPERRSYQFQTSVLCDRLEFCIDIFNAKKSTTDIFIMERSIFSDKIFMQNLYESKKIDKSEYEDYMSMWNLLSNLQPCKIDLFVYLKPGVKVSMNRLSKRNREEESNISLDYQKNLEKLHNETFLSEKLATPVLVINTKDNFIENISSRKIILDSLFQKMIYILE